MTCIVGIVEKGAIYLGADSASCDGSELMVRADRKVFAKNGFVYGFTSSFRMGQLIRYVFAAPLMTPDADVMGYMVGAYIPALRECFRDGGYSRRANEEDIGGTFLVGYRGRLFEVENDFQVGETTSGYNAVGSGKRPALGAMFASTSNTDPASRILLALQAAEQFTTSVRGPFEIISGGRAE